MKHYTTSRDFNRNVPRKYIWSHGLPETPRIPYSTSVDEDILEALISQINSIRCLDDRHTLNVERTNKRREEQILRQRFHTILPDGQGNLWYRIMSEQDEGLTKMHYVLDKPELLTMISDDEVVRVEHAASYLDMGHRLFKSYVKLPKNQNYLPIAEVNRFKQLQNQKNK